MSMRLTLIFALLFAFSGSVVAENVRDDAPNIKRSKLKYRLGNTQIGGNQSMKRDVPDPDRVDEPVANPLNFAYVPLPRYKPGTPAHRKYGGKNDNGYPRTRVPESLIKANKRGEVSIVLNRLQRERDEKTARELRPTLKTTWSSAEITKAVKRCDLVLATTNIDAKRLDPIGGSGGCGIAAPLLVSSFGAVKVNPPAKLNCNLALATYKWLIEKGQPLARKKLKSPIVSMRQYSSYTCRSRRGSGTSRISEHSFGNALDVASFKLANGQTVSVLKDWSTTSALFGIGGKATFLFDIHKAACESFSTALSPRYNKAHANHFHVDMGRGGRYKICE